MIIRISDLYDKGLITGATFLYCVDNDIDTVSDLLCLSDECLSEEICDDIKNVKSELFATGKDLNEAIEVSPQDDIKDVDYNSLYNEYKAIKCTYGNRAKNCLSYIESRFENHEGFLRHLLQIDLNSVLKYPHVGYTTATQIICLSESLKEFSLISSNAEINENEPQDDKIELTTKDKEIIDVLLPTVMSYASNYSVRTKNAIVRLITECNKSVYLLYEKLISPDFKQKKIRNIGKQSMGEIAQFRDLVIDLCRKYVISSESEIQHIFIVQKYVSLNVPAPELIYSKAKELGHFPLLYATSLYISGFAEREKKILNEYLIIYQGNVCRNIDEVAHDLSISRERVRQLSTTILDMIARTVSSWRELMEDYHYPIFEQDAWIQLCDEEQVTLSHNFIKWLISLADTGVFLVGDPSNAFKLTHGKSHTIYLLPRYIYERFNIEAFVEYIRIYNAKTRYENEILNIRNCICDFFRDRVFFELLDEIEIFCRRIISSDVDCYLDGENIVFEANAQKSISDIIEDIIRANGRVMTIKEIYDEYMKLFPGRCTEPRNLQANIRQNKQIKTVGRSGKYTLSEWMAGHKRGGTIREFAYECITNSPQQIVRLDKLCDYIRQYREDVDENSVQTNLLAEASGRYVLYFKEGLRYIGLSSIDYDSAFISQNNTIERRSVKQNYTILETFIVEHKRFPFVCGMGEEPRLYRFWNYQNLKNSRHELDDDIKAIFDSIVERFSEFQVSSVDSRWYKTYLEIISLCDENRDPRNVSRRNNVWIKHNMELYVSNKLSSWQVSLFRDLLDKFKNLSYNA